MHCKVDQGSNLKEPRMSSPMKSVLDPQTIKDALRSLPRYHARRETTSRILVHSIDSEHGFLIVLTLPDGREVFATLDLSDVTVHHEGIIYYGLAY